MGSIGRSRLAVIAALVTTAGIAPKVHAEPTAADKALATTLFKAGRALMNAGEIAKACRKFEESQRLDPGGGTLLNLAVCHEKEGRTATAWAEFVEARSQARREGREERVKLAQERISALEPNLPRMVIAVPKHADVTGLEIRRDGGVIGRAAWGMAMPVDPGDHVIAVTAPGKLPWSTRVSVAKAGYVETVTLDPLADVAPRGKGQGLKTAGFVAGGVGLVWLGVGSFFGLRAFAKRDQSDKHCPRNHCDASGVTLNDQARTAADLSTAAFVVGGVGLALGATLVITGFSAQKSESAPRASLSVGPSWIGVEGAF